MFRTQLYPRVASSFPRFISGATQEPLLPNSSSMHRAKPANNVLRYVLGGVVGLGLLLVTYFGTRSPETSITSIVGGYQCNVPESSYRVVKIFSSRGQLQHSMFVFDKGDETSDLIASASAQKVAVQSSLYHNFYDHHLCKSGKCEGTVLDVGAYLGTHALYLAKLGFAVHAFEPYKEPADLLRCSVVENRLSNMVVIQEGVSNINARECLLLPTTAQQHLTMFAPKGQSNCVNTTQEVDVVTLDHYWGSVLAKKPVAFIKIDAEGHEDYILQGASELLATAPPPYILIEYYPKMLQLKGIPVGSYFSKIRAANYRVYDCQQKREVLDSAEGLALLDAYSRGNLATDLLLVQKSIHDGPMNFTCGY